MSAPRRFPFGREPVPPRLPPLRAERTVPLSPPKAYTTLPLDHFEPPESALPFRPPPPPVPPPSPPFSLVPSAPPRARSRTRSRAVLILGLVVFDLLALAYLLATWRR